MGLRTAVLVLLLGLVPATAVAAPRGVRGSASAVAANATYGARAVVCVAGTPHFRVWWDERRGSRDAPAGVDGSCSTLPPAVRTALGFVERVRAAEIALGFQPPASDAGTPRNGGDGRHDVYFHRPSGAETASEWCMAVSAGARIVRSYSYTVIANHVPSEGGPPDQALEETFAHEYFHGVQCRLAPRLNRLPSWIAEGTANWMAASVAPGAFAGSAAAIGNLMARLVRSADGDVPITAQGYDAWGFWYQLTRSAGGAGRLRDLFRALRTSSAHPVTATLAAFPRAAAALRDYALAIRQGTSLGRTPLPDAYRLYLRPVGDVDLTTSSAASGGDTTLAPLGYTYRTVRWDAGAGTVRVTVHGGARLAGSTALQVAGGALDTAPVVRNDDLEFVVDTAGAAGQALLVVASARTTPTAVTIGAARG